MACKTVLLVFFLVFCGFIGVRGQQVVEIKEDNWEQILKGEWMVEFYAPWCPACKALEPRWQEFSRSGPALGIKVGAVDVTSSPGLSGRFMVTALPTIFHSIDGQFRKYKGARDTDSFSLFIEERKWEQVEPVSRWKAPDSIQMTILSSFFKASQSLRAQHNKFTNEYGWPSIVSYIIFALATIVLGAVLGLTLVFIIDLIFPPKTTPPKKSSGDDGQEDEDDDELKDEDIKDDLVDQDQENEIDSEGDHATESEDGSQKDQVEEEEEEGKEVQTVTKLRERKVKKDM